MGDKKCCQAMYGWQVERTYDITIPKSTVLELRHIKTGARYIHIANNSRENTFAVVFKTVPNTSNGVAHILEHTVLTGSEKYPLRDPFFNMIRRSLNTFMNAFTSSDWTAYPFCSPNKKDYYNLMSVYLDAVFFPRLDKLNFLQEGWRYSLDDDKLKYEGVVYNEMRGVMSSADRWMEQVSMEVLYSEAPYHYNTGGDPAYIPSLSHEKLKDFHAKHYHPNNACFYSYGDLSLSDHLQFINKNVLDYFEKSRVEIKINPETRWTKTKKHKYFYPVASGEDNTSKSQIALAWLVSSVRNNLAVFSLELLEDILIGNSASPVRKALLESGLGSDLCDTCGYDAEMLDTKFILGLKDAKAEDTEKIKELILSCLENLVKNGIDKELIESVLNSNEIRKKNITNKPYPYGLQVFLNIIGPILHSADVREVLDFDSLLEKVRDLVRAGDYFESLIQKYFLDNKHCSLIILAPDESMQDRLDKEAQKKLEAIASSLSDKEKEEIKNTTKALIDLQSSKDNIDCLPSLDLDDIDKEVDSTRASQDVFGNISFYTKNTNGLVYFMNSFDTSGLGDDLKIYVPFFSYLLSRTDTKKTDYQTLAKKIDKLTGGISLAEQASRSYSQDFEYIENMMLQSYALRKNVKIMLGLVEEIVYDFDFSDDDRVSQLLAVMQARHQSQIINQGHIFASMAALAPLSQVNSVNESWQGLGQLDFLNKIKKENNFDDLQKKLNVVGDYFTEKAKTKIALIAESADSLDIKSNLNSLLRKGENVNNKLFEAKNIRHAYQTSTAVSFVAAAMMVPDISHIDAPALLVANNILSLGFLHNEVREKGGAYGGYARYDYNQGLWWFSSYRDPHIVNTLEVFGSSKSFMEQGSYGKNEIKEAIIALSSELDKPGTEIELAKRAFSRDIIALKDETRQLFKENLLKVTKEDVIRVSQKYLKDNWQDYSVAIISSKEKIKEASDKIGELELLQI